MARRFLSYDEAVGLLADGENLHTFRNPGGMLVGCDISRASILKKIEDNIDTVELAGPTCVGLNHGIALNDGAALFVETDSNKLSAFEE